MTRAIKAYVGKLPLIAAVLFCAGFGFAQSTAGQLAPILQQKLQSPEVVAYQLEEYLLRQAPRLPSPSSAHEWAAQLNGIARWAVKQWNPQGVTVVTRGLRSQVVALVAAALEPKAFSKVATHDGIRSFDYLYSKPVKFVDAPEEFCLDLYKDFDLDRLAFLAEPTQIRPSDFLEIKPK